MGLNEGLALLSLIATIAPPAGLLGAVLGMIEAFQQMETVGDRSIMRRRIPWV
jgi:biopolymer transport protein ExbB/TolQ